jgi:hypothetical protein
MTDADATCVDLALYNLDKVPQGEAVNRGDVALMAYLIVRSGGAQQRRQRWPATRCPA